MTTLLLFLFLLVTGFGYLLRFLNLRHLKRYGDRVPSGFEDAIDPELLRRTSAYTFDMSRVGLAESILDNILLVVFLFAGLLPLYDRWVVSLGGSFAVNGVMFFLFLTLFQTALDIPFSLYSTFRIENRYGFNTTTPRLWLGDLVKSTLLSTVLLCLLAGGALKLVQWSPGHWWLWVWGFFVAIGLFIMYVSPYVIEPLFNRFEPLKDEELAEEIREMLDRAGLQVSRVLQVDASKRSRHSNAYFTGIGRTKRIVLYDTLLQQMDRREILAVLAHEAGHWKKGHIRKRIVASEAAAFAGLVAAYWLLRWGGLPGLLGIGRLSFAGQTMILGFLMSLVSFPFTPLSSWFSRRHEREADRFATEISGMPDALASALIKLSKENLSNLHPHPLYATFHYSHPPVVERVNALRNSVPQD
ncbi:MAG: M48 family metallopeptidase [Desulfobacteraceae bacterium]|nr:M48 family metallopeptidase [Desulfobacteraceae bacterium]